MDTMQGDLFAWRCFLTQAMGGNNSVGLFPLTGRKFTYNPIGVNWNDTPPELIAQHGFWAFKTRSHLLRYVTKSRNPRHARTFNPYLFAVVRLYGEVAEHQIGYRSEGLEIVSLYGFQTNQRRRQLAHQIGWPGRIRHISDSKDGVVNNLIRLPKGDSRDL